MNLFISMYSKSRFLCVFCRRIVKARKVDRALRNVFCIVTLSIVIYVDNRGGSRGRAFGAPLPPPPKIWKNKIFWHKMVIFHTKSPNIFFLNLLHLTWNPGSAPGQYKNKNKNVLLPIKGPQGANNLIQWLKCIWRHTCKHTQKTGKHIYVQWLHGQIRAYQIPP